MPPFCSEDRDSDGIRAYHTTPVSQGRSLTFTHSVQQLHKGNECEMPWQRRKTSPSTEEMIAGHDYDRLVQEPRAATTLKFLGKVVDQSLSIDGLVFLYINMLTTRIIHFSFPSLSILSAFVSDG